MRTLPVKTMHVALLLPLLAIMRWWSAAGVILATLLAGGSDSDTAMRVEAIQHRGWWEVRYADGTVAANELHVPAGRRVRVDATLDGAGLLWFDDGHFPRIGRSASAVFTQAAGRRAIAHSLHISKPHESDLIIIGDDRFDEWLVRQKSDAAAPANAIAARGREVFATARCTLCHTVRGVAAAEQPNAPDLTHVASRGTLAAGALPNHTGTLAGWIVDAERLKPGAGMPVNNIDSGDLQALLSFLQALR